MTVKQIQACMGGWCAKRAACLRYYATSDAPAERMCGKGAAAQSAYSPMLPVGNFGCEPMPSDGVQATPVAGGNQ